MFKKTLIQEDSYVHPKSIVAQIFLFISEVPVVWANTKGPLKAAYLRFYCTSGTLDTTDYIMVFSIYNALSFYKHYISQAILIFQNECYRSSFFQHLDMSSHVDE